MVKLFKKKEEEYLTLEKARERAESTRMLERAKERAREKIKDEETYQKQRQRTQDIIRKRVEAQREIEKAEKRADIKEKLRRFGDVAVSGKADLRRVKGRKAPIRRRITRFADAPGRAVGLKEARTKYGAKLYGIGGTTVRISKPRKRKIRQTTTGRTTGRVGRPPGTLKVRINPFTGKPIKIPAKEYYKLLRAFRQQSEAIANARDRAEVRALAKRGIPPEQAKVIADTRQLRSVGALPPTPTVPQYQKKQVVQPQEYRQELQRIRTMQPWARTTALKQLQRRIEIDRRIQNGGDTRRYTPPPQRTEVSLMTGRPYVSNDFERRERWTTN